MKGVFAFVFALLLLFGCTISVNPQDLAPSKNYSVVSDGNNFNSSPIVLNLAQVAKHNSKGNCWMIINSNVYDLSTYVAHPGGSGYLRYCGTEATLPYDTKDGRGGAHSNYADVLLANYLVGKVGQEIIIQNNGSQSNNNSNPTPNLIDDNNLINNPVPIQISLTLSEVAKHSKSNNCWMVINGKVYDLSVYVSHPGGSGYLSFCGTEATTEYDTKGGKRSKHSSYADSLLSNYLIGQLGQTVVVNNTNNFVNPNLPSYNDDFEDDDEFEDDD